MRSDLLGPEQHAGPSRFVRRLLITAAIALTAVVVLAALYAAADIFLLVFASALIALLLHGAADWLANRTGLAAGWALLVVLVVLAGTLALLGMFIAGRLAAQLDELAETIPRAAEELASRAEQHDWARPAVASLRRAARAPALGEVPWGRVTGLFTATFGLLGNVVVLLFLSVYLSAEPGLYRRGALLLVPPRRRGRAAEVLDRLAEVLRRWLAAKLAAMVLVGALTGLGLWLLGLPLALSLALLAAGLTFIPYFGPLLAAVPAVLLALLHGPATAGWVALLYVGVQAVESYLFTPLLMHRAADLPPALSIFAILLLGGLFGAWGAVLATPLAAAALVLVRMLYVEDVLGEPAAA